ncbi:hypothetical protein DMA11_05955 [Marinilabiliaceae bacterium JC017]|nr:hypothetical protein DMA11_05955 [Marinilabiliaceae bacterium JC017]
MKRSDLSLLGFRSVLIFLIVFSPIFIPGINATVSWKGTISSNWDEPGNWDSGYVPIAEDDVLIPNSSQNNHSPVLSGNIEIGGLLIEDMVMLTVAKTARLTISGDLTNQGTLLIKMDTDELASVIVRGDILGSGESKIEFDFTSRTWWYAGHAMDGLVSSVYDAADPGKVKFYTYDNAIGDWSQIISNVEAFDEPLKGYHFNFKDPTTVTYSGLLYNGNYEMTPLGSGWWLMANPYPAYVDLNFEKDLPGTYWTFNNINKFVYLRTIINGERMVVTYDINTPTNSHDVATNYLAPMQAFWVKSSGNGTFGVNNGARFHDPDQGGLKATTLLPENVLRFKLINQYTYDYAAICFDENGSLDYTMNDAEKFYEANGRVPKLYTKKGDKRIVINKLPLIGDYTAIPLYIEIASESEGNLIFDAFNITDFNEDITVILEDLKTGKHINLKDQPQYEFYTEDVVDEKRFILHLTDNLVTKQVENESLTEAVSIKKIGQKVTIRMDDNLFVNRSNPAIIRLITLTGEVLKQATVTSNTYELESPMNKHIYIVEVVVGGQRYSKKLFGSD